MKFCGLLDWRMGLEWMVRTSLGRWLLWGRGKKRNQQRAGDTELYPSKAHSGLSCGSRRICKLARVEEYAFFLLKETVSLKFEKKRDGGKGCGKTLV